MRLRNVAFAFVLLVGSGLVFYGAATGDQGTVSITVNEMETSDLPADADVTQYDLLDPAIQDAFREAIQTGDEVSVTSPPAPDQPYVEYRETTYRYYTEYGAANMTTMVFSIAGGLAVVVLGAIGWTIARRRDG